MSETSITLRQLRYLVALLRHRNFGEAAQRCGISQPSLSTQIQTLERALDLKLVERGRDGVIATAAGREIAERGRRILEDIAAIEDFAAEARGGSVGTLRLGSKPTLGPYLLPFLVGRLHREDPELKLYIRETLPSRLEQELRDGEHDAILAQLPVGKGIVAERLFREPLYLAMARDHPLAERESLSLADLEGKQVLALRPGFHLHDDVAALCAEHGAILQKEYEGTSLDALRQMVGMGMGVTFLPALYVASEIHSGSEVVTRRLKGRRIERAIGFACRERTGFSVLHRRLIALLRQIAAEEFDGLIVD